MLPATQVAPEKQPLQAQAPPAQVAPTDEQLWQLEPWAPHWPSDVAVWQVPSAATHPAQLGSRQTPALQACDPRHTLHSVPLLPQLAAVSPAAQVPAASQQPLQVRAQIAAGEAHTDSEQIWPFWQELHA